MEYIITDHAKERYAERIADREGIHDIKQWVACNDEKIVKDINQMMTYATLIAQGKFGKGYSAVRVYNSGLWVLLADITEPRIITLYNVDLKVGDEFNKAYMKKALEAIEAAKTDYESAVETTREEVKGLEDYRDANLDTIAEMKSTIKGLEKLNDDINATIRDFKAKNRAAELIMIKTVEDLITKKNF